MLSLARLATQRVSRVFPTTLHENYSIAWILVRTHLLRSSRCWDARSWFNSTSRIDCCRLFYNCYRCCRLIALFLFRLDFCPFVLLFVVQIFPALVGCCTCYVCYCFAPVFAKDMSVECYTTPVSCQERLGLIKLGVIKSLWTIPFGRYNKVSSCGKSAVLRRFCARRYQMFRTVLE